MLLLSPHLSCVGRNDGQDAIYGGDDNDSVGGGTGVDTIYGGDGDDSISVSAALSS